MSKRICDACGEKKDLSGGKTCEKGHFICYSCRDAGAFYPKKQCSICKKSLR